MLEQLHDCKNDDIRYNHSRGTQHVIGTVSNEATDDMGYQSWPLWRTCNMNMDMVIKLCLVGVFLGFLFQAVASQLERNIFCHDFGA